MTKQEVINAVDMICSVSPRYTGKKKGSANSVWVIYGGKQFMEFPIDRFVLSARNGWPFDYDKELVISETPGSYPGNPQCTVIGFSSITAISLH